MTDLEDWLDARRPRPPSDLRRRVVECVTRVGGEEDRVRQLLEAASERLTTARDRPGRVRSSAFELLVADALVTYACEAALETARPEEALRRIVEVERAR